MLLSTWDAAFTTLGLCLGIQQRQSAGGVKLQSLTRTRNLQPAGLQQLEPGETGRLSGGSCFRLLTDVVAGISGHVHKASKFTFDERKCPDCPHRRGLNLQESQNLNLKLAIFPHLEGLESTSDLGAANS